MACNDKNSITVKSDIQDIHFVPAPCQVACPIGTDAASYIGYIWEGDIEGAFEAITATNPLSSICGRVCDAPCEPACRRADSDGPIAIRNLKRFVMDKLGKSHPLPQAPVTQKKTIGIVGGGPTGLTAAGDLAQAGYEVHIYEMTDRLGGMVIWGIPAFRLPPDVIEEDIDRLLAMCPGIKVHCNHSLGKEITLDSLKEKHDAVLLAIGAWWGKDMGVAGEDDPAVIDGVGFLRDVNAGNRPQMPETVVVVGGGDVAMDACRVALRLPGCKNVKVVYRRGPKEIPARRDELEGAIKEGIEFTYYTQPVGVEKNGKGIALRCVLTELGEPEEDGRRRPVSQAGSEHDVSCGMVIAAVGQKAENDELLKLGMMVDDKITTDFKSMLTADPKVFAAGDGAFGPSTIVEAMYHGHRGAYYVQAFLEGNENLPEYQTPFRTRRVPVSQDPDWEVNLREEQPFHGVGKNPVAFPEIESTYTLEQARREAARCYRCDVENGTHEYSVQNREDIFRMARTKTQDVAKMGQILKKRMAPREDPFSNGHLATLDDICFLPANLSRLVIDPYREACKTTYKLGGRIALETPILVTGFDAVPQAVKTGLGAALASAGSLYLGLEPLVDDSRWIQYLKPGETRVRPDALGAIALLGNTFVPVSLERSDKEQLLGLAGGAPAIEKAAAFAIENEYDLLLMDTTGRLSEPWPELGSQDMSVTPRAIRTLRELRSEEIIDLLYFGGVRSGTDAAKTVAMGCQVTLLSVAVALAMGGQIGAGGAVQFSADLSADECREAAANFLKACTSEASMMARCTGKTNIQSLEPEDLRCITLATKEATSIPVAGTN